MKRFLFFAALAFALVGVMSSCENEPTPQNTPTPVESVTITPSTCEIMVDEELTLTVEVVPADTSFSTEWISTNTDVVTVNNGTIRGVASGTAIVMAQVGHKTASCTVSVVSTPVESITLNYHELELEEGSTFTLSATVAPEDADNKSVLWTSSDPNIVKVNGAGTLTTLRPGEATITAKAGNFTDECVVTVTAAPLSVGDFYYSDGTWSQSLDPTRTPIGVVFHVGDITQYDPLLSSEHPHCTHGLVVALDEVNGIPWQRNYKSVGEYGAEDYVEGYDDTVGRWVEMNTDYETITSGYELADNLNRPMGYHNSKAIEAFNADPANSAWPVTAMEWIVDYRTKVAAPEQSSGWYLGSSKEYSLLVSGEYSQNIWDIRDEGISVQNKKEINEKIAQIEGATQIGVTIPIMMFYWTSTEFTWEFAGGMMPMNGQMPQMFKGDDQTFYSVRAILAF